MLSSLRHSTSFGNIALLSLLGSAFAQNSSLPLSQSTTCDEKCQQNVQLGINFEHDSHAHTPLDDFYSIPKKFNPSMEPGTLLRVETHTNLTNYTVPSGLTMSRIMYTSQSLNGTIVPASAFVLWPYSPYEYEKGASKFPMVAWAHGTSGQFVDCAPSNYRSLQYHFMTSWTLALEGFAVVAADYAGLGVTTRPNGEQSHEYLVGPAGANDVAYAIEAARKAFPEQLAEDGPFVTMGHSQGGNIAWAFAERQAQSPQRGYRGTISISPPTRGIRWLEVALKLAASTPASSLPPWARTILGLQPTIIASVTTLYPQYNYSGMTPISYDRWNNVLKPLQGCLPTMTLAFADVPSDQLAKPNWTANHFVQEWGERAAVSGKKFKGPLLVLVGEIDAIPLDMLAEDVDASCQMSSDQSLEMLTYSSMQHFPVIQASRAKWVNWIKEQVANSDTYASHKGHGACGKKSVVKGFNTNYTLQSFTPNWLVDWVPMDQGWKLSL